MSILSGHHRVRRFIGVLAVMLSVTVLIAKPASAFIFVVPAPSYPSNVTVGQTFPAALGIGNFSTPPESVTFPVLRISTINHVPSCGTAAPAANCTGNVEAGVFDLSATGVGVSGPATCLGVWTITEIVPAGLFRFTPPGGEGSLLLATGETCVVNFTATTLRVPTFDVDPAPGVQTLNLATVVPSAPAGTPVFPANSGAFITTVAPATPDLETTAAQSSPTIPATTTDTADLIPPPPPSSGLGDPPTGTITFNLFGPANPTCVGPPIYTEGVVVNGFGTYGPTTPFAINTPGTYNWVASYSGDANYTPVGPTGCGDPFEIVTFAPPQPTISTVATPPAVFGGTSTDAATLTAPVGITVPPAPAPGGTITFNLFGPNNPTCDPLGAIHSTSTVPVNHFGPPPYPSAPSGPIVTPGTYHWVASYSGDANYMAAGPTACLDPAETFVVAPPQPTISTVAVPGVFGGTTTDSATLTAPVGVTVPPSPAPTGSITFNLFGPNNPTCDPLGAIHSTSTVPVNHFGPPPYPSAPSNPIVTPGTYHWVAQYSGDANYQPAGPTACLDPAETFTVVAPQPSITTVATAPPVFGGTSTDSATLTAPVGVTVPPAPAPGGTITFNLFGPNNPTCDPLGAIHSTSTVPVDHFGPPPYPSAVSNPIVAPGTYHWTATYSGDANYMGAGPTACLDPAETFVVAPPPPSIATVATAPLAFGGTSTDAATLTAPVGVTVPPAPAPGGTITFNLFGPNNPTCDPLGPIHSTSTVPVNHFGPPPYPSAPSGPIVAPGTYHWVASYSGDANYAAAGPTACLDPAETFVVAPPPPTISTVATPPPALGGTSTDAATLTAPVGVTVPPAPAPGGTITFNLFGPNNPTCDPLGAIHSTSTVPVNHFGPPPYPSAPSNPIVTAGTYHWVASYSGDANYAAAGPTTCTDPAETFQVLVPNPSITTVATPPAAPGGTSTDAATLTAPVGVTVPPAPAPTGIITFQLFGPNNPTCDQAGPVHSTSTAPVNHFGPPPYPSAPSNPVVTPGTYHWVATYSGDANYGPAGPTACLDPAETFTVLPPPPPSISTVATPPAGFGGTSTDSATLTAPAGVTVPPFPAPTGTITFNLFGPNNPTCNPLGAIHSTSSTPVDHFGPPPYPSAISNPITAPGTYHWTATYSGDVNYAGAGPTACADPAETFVVSPPPLSLTTVAAGAQSLGGTSTDAATLSASGVTVPPAPAPTGTITFNLYGPNNPTCDPLGPIHSTSTVAVDHFGAPAYPSATSGPIVTPGTYHWTATYSGDANYPAAGPTACLDPAETFSVGQPPPPSIITVATGPQNLGGTASDTATLSAPAGITVPPAPAPTGTITFRLFGPDNPTCDPAGAVHSTSTVAADHFGPPPYASAASSPITTPGTYHWTATYSGDANYPAAGPTACLDPAETFEVLPAPVIQVVKTATPLSLPAPGGSFTFDVVVTNPSVEPLTITSLTDNIYGNIATQGTCTTAIGTVLAPNGGTYACSFPGNFFGNAGDSQTDIVTVTGQNPRGTTVTDTDDAVVTLTPAPAIQVVKTANPLSLPAPGGTFTFDVVVTNPSPESVTITSLTDDIYGNIATQGTCTTAIGTVLAPNGGTYSCSFPGNFTGNAGDSQTDTVTVTGRNPTGTTVTDTDDAVVTLTPAPAIQVIKSANPLSLPAPGGTFTFDVVVINPSPEPVTITSLTDNIYGNIATQGTCTTAIGTVLAPNGGTYNCSFQGNFFGNAGDSQTDTVTVIGRNPTGTTVTDTDDAVVTLTPAPAIQVVKTANPLSLPAPGGKFTFDVVVTNPAPEPVTITSLTDDVYGNIATQGTCTNAIGTVLAPNGGTYSCSFVGEFFGNAGDSQTDTVTVTGRNPTGTTVTDTDDAVVTLTPVTPTIAITKTASPLSLPAPGGTFTFTVVITNTSPEPLTIISLVDDVYGDLSTQGTCTTAVGTVLGPAGQPGDSYTCDFQGTFTGNGGDAQTDTVTVRGRNPRGVEVTAEAKATVHLVAVTVPVVPGVPLVKTGADMVGPIRAAAILTVTGFLLLAATWRRQGFSPATPEAVRRGRRGPDSRRSRSTPRRRGSRRGMV